MISKENTIKNRILIIGSNGMLGQSLTTHFMFRKDVELMCASFEDKSFYDEIPYAKIDISSSKEVKKVIKNQETEDNVKSKVEKKETVESISTYFNVDKNSLNKTINQINENELSLDLVSFLATYKKYIENNLK